MPAGGTSVLLGVGIVGNGPATSQPASINFGRACTANLTAGRRGMPEP